MNPNHEPLDQAGAMPVADDADDAEFDDLDISLLSTQKQLWKPA